MIGITRGLGTWKMQDHYVERVMDNAAYTAAHPDDTLVLAGPPRTPDSTDLATRMLAIGHLQQFNITQQKPTQPVMAIGSGRTFFVSGKAQGQGTMGRLFVNGRNLLRVAYHNARVHNLNVQDMDDRPATRMENQYYINLDSELYLIPVGFGCLFRDKIHDLIGGFYSELSMITSYAIGFSAGQNMVMEQVSFVFDRLLPFSEETALRPDYNIQQATLNAVIGFVDGTREDARGPGTLTDAQPARAG